MTLKPRCPPQRSTTPGQESGARRATCLRRGISTTQCCCRPDAFSWSADIRQPTSHLRPPRKSSIPRQVCGRPPPRWPRPAARPGLSSYSRVWCLSRQEKRKRNPIRRRPSSSSSVRASRKPEQERSACSKREFASMRPLNKTNTALGELLSMLIATVGSTRTRRHPWIAACRLKTAATAEWELGCWHWRERQGAWRRRSRRTHDGPRPVGKFPDLNSVLDSDSDGMTFGNRLPSDCTMQAEEGPFVPDSWICLCWDKTRVYIHALK
jgi:hypothetical protein